MTRRTDLVIYIPGVLYVSPIDDLEIVKDLSDAENEGRHRASSGKKRSVPADGRRRGGGRGAGGGRARGRLGRGSAGGSS